MGNCLVKVNNFLRVSQNRPSDDEDVSAVYMELNDAMDQSYIKLFQKVHDINCEISTLHRNIAQVIADAEQSKSVVCNMQNQLNALSALSAYQSLVDSPLNDLPTIRAICDQTYSQVIEVCPSHDLALLTSACGDIDTDADASRTERQTYKPPSSCEMTEFHPLI